MQRTLHLKLLPSEALNDSLIKNYIAQAIGESPGRVTGYVILKRSIDARGKQPWINLSLQAFIDEPAQTRQKLFFDFQDVHTANRKVIIIGAGPAGLFAALRLIELGIKPVILERGKNVRERRRDLAVLNKQGTINPESNYCFGEGGAGTYSDGKLYTRSTKRGDVNRILNSFYHFGAGENILFESHPHIGTNKLPHIITAMREQIVSAGGELLFEKKVTDLIISKARPHDVFGGDKISAVKTSDNDVFGGDAIILATGHSARDIFHLFYQKNILIESKPFALGVRVEHPQALINSIQYHCNVDDCSPALPPAAYSLVHQASLHGVFSFCMCPGGIIAPASTNHGELVVNGWSPSKRNNPYANSGIVVQVRNQDLGYLMHKEHKSRFEKLCALSSNVLTTPLGMMYFQQYVERMAFTAGGGKFVAPAQRMTDFCNETTSASLPACSYVPGIHSFPLATVLPPFVCNSLQRAFKDFGRKMKGYYTNEAVVVATESRTSSPVRIPRQQETLQHPQISNLYPCGEGAGYAGGIVSAAMDGEKVADIIAARLQAH